MPPFAFGLRCVYIVQGNSRTHTALVLNYTHETPLNSHKLIEIPESKIPSSTYCQQLRVVDDWLHVAILSIGRLSPHLSSRCQEDGDTEGIPGETMTTANMGSKKCIGLQYFENSDRESECKVCILMTEYVSIWDGVERAHTLSFRFNAQD